jgi:predicted type IV restriction endonuclease
MRYSINDKTLAAEKARILIKALIDCVKAGVKPSFVTNQMLWGISLYLECGKFKKENRRTYSRVSDAARRVVESGDKDWKRKVTFEHVRPLSKMYQMLFEERKTLTLERAAYIIGEYPPILITLEEEFEMAARGFKTAGKPNQRYAKIPITGFTLRGEFERVPGKPNVAAE